MSSRPRYMNVLKFQYIYNAMTSETLEHTSGCMWNAILNLYFPQDEFIITPNSRPADSVKTRADFTIYSVMGADKTQLVVLFEDKRTFNETINASCEEGIGQLTDYMIQSRKVDTESREIAGLPPYDMYGILNVGSYSHIYMLKSDGTTLQRLSNSGNQEALHFKDDELEIVAIVKELVRKSLPHGFLSSPYSPSFFSSSSSSSAGASRQASPAAGSRLG
ncbi:uncharacterized protein B0H64DRAFT_412104 [Chaetomium fimeti]|uniref:Uncharacterized protein n=1 Tax=Chaetomium fimeti TaxID=1854472 RepID=A0AAE0H6U7_9PEZI|nr:hypothetical protein B0H64DRAFT_412104 [Chaetomium fimeti]